MRPCAQGESSWLSPHHQPPTFFHFCFRCPEVVRSGRGGAYGALLIAWERMIGRLAAGGAAAAAGLAVVTSPTAQRSGSPFARSKTEQHQSASSAHERTSLQQHDSLIHIAEHVIHHEHPLSDALHIKPNPFLLDRASLSTSSAARVAAPPAPEKGAVKGGAQHAHHDHAALSHALHVPPNPFGL